jgi:hypothetical protein
VTDEFDDELRLETGGPAWRLWLRTGLAPTSPAALGRRALVLAGLAWLPLLAFSLVDGLALDGGAVRVPLLRDFSVYARFLLGVLLLVLADAAVGARLRLTLQRFNQAELVTPASQAEFVAAIARARRRASATLPELVLLALAYALAWTSVRRELADGVSTWQGLAEGGTETLTAAGWWYALVSVPMFQFLFLRWSYRAGLWMVLLARVSRLDLRLVATHPDRAAGLGFLAYGQAGFAILVFAASASLSSVLLGEIVYQHVPLESFYPAMAGFIALVVVLVLTPLVVFAPRLIRLKQDALFAYGALATGHDDAFRAKWIGDRVERAALLGDPDPSSLADLGSTYDRIERLRPLPFDATAIVPVALGAILPMLPVVATKVPLREIALGLLKTVL